MTTFPDLPALRAAAQRTIERHVDRPLPDTWRLVRLDGLPAIAPTCDRDHRGRTPAGPDTDSLHDCGPHPWIRVGPITVADLLLALLNHQTTQAQAQAATATARPEPFSDDPTGAWT